MKRFLLMLVVLVMSVITVACSSSSESEDENKANEVEKEESETVTVKHIFGETEVEKNPEKVLVFDFGVLDTLDALGIDVVGIPQQTVPAYLEKYKGADYENLGGLKEPDFEKIAEIDPDLIIISGRQGEVYDELSKLGPTIDLQIDTTRYMESLEENLRVIGEIFEKEDEIEAELEKINESIESLQAQAEENEINALIILANEDKISAYGPNSRFGIIHDVFGIPPVDENIEVSTHGMNVSFEYVAEQDPDYLFVVDRSAAIGGEATAKQIVENKLMENTKSYQNDNIYYLNPDYWYLSGGGIISTNEMINEIAKSIE